MKAIVLCAGFGTRLGDLTKEVPKAMLPIDGRPLLAYILGHLKQQGFDEITMNLHFKPELIRDYFGTGAGDNLKLTYSYEPKLLGTAGGVKNLEHFFLSEESFLVQYGDVITDQDFRAMHRFHCEKQALATLLLHQRVKSNSIVTLDEKNRIAAFLERPSEEARNGQTSRWVNSGICICHRDVMQEIPANTAVDLPREIFPKLIPTRRLFGFPLSGYRCAIDSPERLVEARAALAERRCQIRPLAGGHTITQKRS
jgi:NDP-sugar pyrophosphorylase family protein